MKVTLYKYSGEVNRLNKTLTNALEIDNGRPLTKGSVLLPSLRVETASDIVDYNFAYITDYKRYYFITDIIWEGNNVWRLELAVDPLKTYMSEILNFDVRVARNQYSFNPSLDDTLTMSGGIGNITAINQGLGVPQSVTFDDIIQGGDNFVWRGSSEILDHTPFLERHVIMQFDVDYYEDGNGTATYPAGYLYVAVSMDTYITIMQNFKYTADDALSILSSYNEMVHSLKNVFWVPYAIKYVNQTTEKCDKICFYAKHLLGVPGTDIKVTMGPTNAPGVPIIQPGQTVDFRWRCPIPSTPVPTAVDENGTNVDLIYTKLPPYKNYFLRFFPFGVMELPATLFSNSTYVYLRARVQLECGKATLYCGNSSGGENYFLGQTDLTNDLGKIEEGPGYDFMNSVSETLAGMKKGSSEYSSLVNAGEGGGGYTNAGMAGLVIGAIKMAPAAWRSVNEIYGSTIGQPGVGYIDNAPAVYIIYKNVIVPDPSLYGLPCYQNKKTLSHYYGFTMCDAVFTNSIPGATSKEAVMINDYLKNGVILDDPEE